MLFRIRYRIEYIKSFSFRCVYLRRLLSSSVQRKIYDQLKKREYVRLILHDQPTPRRLYNQPYEWLNIFICRTHRTTTTTTYERSIIFNIISTGEDWLRTHNIYYDDVDHSLARLRHSPHAYIQHADTHFHMSCANITHSKHRWRLRKGALL